MNRQLAEVIVAIGLAALLVPLQDVEAQINEIGSGMSITPRAAHEGDTITIAGVDVSQQAFDSGLTNASVWVVMPNNSAQLVFTNGTISAGQCGSCPPGFLSCLGTVSCLPGVSFMYVVNAADVGRDLSFTIPVGFPWAGSSFLLSGAPHYVQFSPIGLGWSMADGGPLANLSETRALIVHPSITITKQCATNCTPYGQPILFTGTICNSGDDTLNGVAVSDAPAATITFATSTSFGTNSFPAAGGGRLLPGECVNFSGSYTPSGNLCGPFTNTIIASATESPTGPFKFALSPATLANPLTMRATNTVTCFVCNNPAIAVTKACPPTPVPPGGTLNFTGTVTNTGDVPLTSVLVFNDQPSPGTLVFGPAMLAPGEGAIFGGSYVVPTSSLGPYVDTLTATGVGLCGSAVFNTFTAVCQAQTRSPYNPPPYTVSISPHTNGGNVTMAVSVDLPDTCHHVGDWGQPLIVGTNVYVDAQFWVTNIVCLPVVMTVSNNYALSELPPGDYTFSFQVWGNVVKSQAFSVPPPSPPQPVVITNVTVSDGYFQCSFPTQSNYTYAVQFIDSVRQTNWMMLTNVLGDGSIATVTDVTTNAQRCYRVDAH